jgi:hypothetical protein
MSVTDLLDPSRKDLIAALQAATEAANFRRRTGRPTHAAADCEGLVSLSTAQSQGRRKAMAAWAPSVAAKPARRPAAASNYGPAL